MVKIKEAIVVEGRYDKNTLSQIVDAPILETSGFGIFKNKQQLKLLRKVAQLRGLIVFTDADGAGFVIRNHLKSAIPNKFLKHAYIPDIPGKEKRKAVSIYVQASNITDANKLLQRELTNLDCEVISITRSPILEVYRGTYAADNQ